MTRRAAIAFVIAPLAAVLAGCNYHLGTEANPPFSSITVAAVKNATYEPQLQAVIHAQLVDSLAQEKSLHVVPSGGQALISVTLSDYKRDVSAVNPQDTGTASSYDLTLTAKVTLTDVRGGKVLFHDRVFKATLPAFAQTGFINTETQTLPLLTRELAKQIKDAVVDVW